MMVKILAVTVVIIGMVFVTMDIIRIVKRIELTANHWNPEYKA